MLCMNAGCCLGAHVVHLVESLVPRLDPFQGIPSCQRAQGPGTCPLMRRLQTSKDPFTRLLRLRISAGLSQDAEESDLTCSAHVRRQLPGNPDTVG